MSGTAEKMISGKSKLQSKRSKMKENFGDANFILDQISEFVRSGDISSTTDLIGAYITNSSLYKSQEEFARSIGTSRQTLHRMLSHSDGVSVKVFFGAIEKIFEDTNKKS